MVSLAVAEAAAADDPTAFVTAVRSRGRELRLAGEKR
jgi:hypothetical protein